MTPITDSIAEKFYDLGLVLSQPFYETHTLFTDNWILPVDKTISVIVKRIFSIAAFVPSGILYVLGGVSHLIGNSLSSKGYYYIPGNPQAEVIDNGKYTTFDNNVCMYWGGLPKNHGGKPTARERYDSMAEFIRQQKANTIFLQEVSFGSGKALAKKLHNDYAHFYTFMGSYPLCMESGLFVATNYPVKSAEFVPFPACGGVRKGFFILEVEKGFIINTHLYHKDDVRKEQLNMVTKKVQELKAQNPDKFVMVQGDLNIQYKNNPNDEYHQWGIQENYYDWRIEHHPEFNENTATCNQAAYEAKMLGRPIPQGPQGEEAYEIVDYVLVDKNSRNQIASIDVQLIENPGSDHRGYKTTFEVT